MVKGTTGKVDDLKEKDVMCSWRTPSFGRPMSFK